MDKFCDFRFKDINLWPSRQVNNFMPKAFEDSYPTTQCIIDATEIFVQAPSNPQAQQSIY